MEFVTGAAKDGRQADALARAASRPAADHPVQALPERSQGPRDDGSAHAAARSDALAASLSRCVARRVMRPANVQAGPLAAPVLHRAFAGDLEGRTVSGAVQELARQYPDEAASFRFSTVSPFERASRPYTAAEVRSAIQAGELPEGVVAYGPKSTAPPRVPTGGGASTSSSGGTLVALGEVPSSTSASSSSGVSTSSNASSSSAPGRTFAPHEVVQQFEHTGIGGGLYLRATHSEGELRTFVESIPASGTSIENLKKRTFNLEKYSHIRSDTSMALFGGRTFGLLVNPHLMSGHVMMRGNPLASGKIEFMIDPEDATSSGNAKPLVAADFDAGRRGLPAASTQVGVTLNWLIEEQNRRKKRSKKVANWNEVQALTAPPEAYVGLFYTMNDEAFETSFPVEKRKDLAALWQRKTGQPSLKIYRYTLGQPSSSEETARALVAERLGARGASALELAYDETP